MLSGINKLRQRNSVAVVLVLCLSVAGCATRNGTNQASAGKTDDECNPWVAAVAGAIGGALLTKGNDRAKGAAIGAGVGSLACLAWNYNSRQTKTAAQTQEDYRAVNRGQLPSRSTVTRYDTSLDSGGRVSPGSKLVVSSNIEVVQGTSDKAVVIEEELKLNRPDGTELKTIRKRANDNTSAGAYRTTYSVTMPEGVQQGQYPIQTALYVNGERMAGKNLQMQVVQGLQGIVIALSE